MKSFLLLLFFLSFTLSGFSQAFTISGLTSLNDLYTFETSKMVTLNGKRYEEIEGTPYKNETFVPGSIVINDSVSFQEIPLRYNAYSGKMEFKSSNNMILELNIANGYKKVTIGDEKFENVDYMRRDKTEHGLLKVLVAGDYKLYMRSAVNYQPATEAAGYQEATPDKFVWQDDEYYWSKNGEIPVLITRIKNLVDSLQQSKEGVKAYIKSQKLTLKKESDLIQLFEFCN